MSFNENKIDEIKLSDILKLFAELYNLQGGCERIKSTPLFRQVGVFSWIFVSLFIFLVPLVYFLK
jgi:putative membrane protein